MTASRTSTPVRAGTTRIGTPELGEDDALLVTTHLDERLVSLIDLLLTLKHVHWNVRGPSFAAVHEMLDDQVTEVQPMADDIAERIAALGGIAIGTPKSVASRRSWADYSLLRASADTHLVELGKVYTGIIGSHRAAAAAIAHLDPVSEHMLLDQLAELERFRWIVGSHRTPE